ncbi:MAG: DNA-processing protein DprA [Geminicoccaceae bacterium]
MARVLSRSEKIDWLQLCRSGGVGPQTFFKLLRRFGSARRALDELPRLAREAGGEDRWRRCQRDEAEDELAATLDLGCALIAQGEPGYPRRLAEIADPPPLLIVRGRVELLEHPAIAVVGARNASGNGRMFARGLASELAAAGLLVISGLARGIDAAAHEGALSAGAPTIAVIASGVDVAYPSDNAELMERIAATGAIVSERPLGAVPQARHFPRRNRLISGLSLGVVVVEAAPNSGSLITARLAAEQGREVMAVPGSPLDPRHRGTNQLLRDGATLVESAADVVTALGPLAPDPNRRTTRATGRTDMRATGRTEEFERPAAPAPLPLEPAAGGSDVIGRVCERLGPEPLLVDELIRQCQASTAEVQRALMELELDGRLERHPGNRVSLAAG